MVLETCKALNISDPCLIQKTVATGSEQQKLSLLWFHIPNVLRPLLLALIMRYGSKFVFPILFSISPEVDFLVLSIF
jgi:hypothetical protein